MNATSWWLKADLKDRWLWTERKFKEMSLEPDLKGICGSLLRRHPTDGLSPDDLWYMSRLKICMQNSGSVLSAAEDRNSLKALMRRVIINMWLSLRRKERTFSKLLEGARAAWDSGQVRPHEWNAIDKAWFWKKISDLVEATEDLQLLVWVFKERKDSATVAELMGISNVAVRKRVQRVLVRLRAKVEELGLVFEDFAVQE